MVLETYHTYITCCQQRSYRRREGRVLKGRKMDDIMNIIKKYDFLHLANVKLLNQIKKINSMIVIFLIDNFCQGQPLRFVPKTYLYPGILPQQPDNMMVVHCLTTCRLKIT
jgi:hypothetical protein